MVPVAGNVFWAALFVAFKTRELPKDWVSTLINWTPDEEEEPQKRKEADMTEGVYQKTYDRRFKKGPELWTGAPRALPGSMAEQTKEMGNNYLPRGTDVCGGYTRIFNSLTSSWSYDLGWHLVDGEQEVSECSELDGQNGCFEGCGGSISAGTDPLMHVSFCGDVEYMADQDELDLDFQDALSGVDINVGRNVSKRS